MKARTPKPTKSAEGAVTHDELAARVWRLMFDFLMATSPARVDILARMRLTANDARALGSLSEAEGRPVGSLAREWQCDPSNATFIMDRLVRMGLASREECAKDRRIKLARLTVLGAQTRAKFMDECYVTPKGFDRLSGDELGAMEAALLKIVDDSA